MRSDFSRLVEKAKAVFPEATVAAAYGRQYEDQRRVDAFSYKFSQMRSQVTDFETWWANLRKRISSLMWPGGVVTCLRCDGDGCDKCRQSGRRPLGTNPSEISKVELALRLLLNALPYCPTSQLSFAERAVDMIAARWTKLRAENQPPF